MSTVPEPRRAGRPVDADKRRAILDAAIIAFFEQGYEACSIEGIADAAGVSKVTVYNHFGGKEALFVAAVQLECEGIRGAFEPQGDEREIRERLIHVAREMHAFLFRPKMLKFDHYVAAEAQRIPEIGEMFLEAGPRAMKKALAELLQRANDRGEIACTDCELAAEQFAGMTKGMADLEWRFAGVHDAQRSERRIEAAVDTFLRAYGTAPPAVR